MRGASLLVAVVACGAQGSSGEHGLADAGRIALPGVSGRIDHLAFDAEHGRLYVCALGNGSVEVVDVAAGKVVKTLAKFDEPQGVVAIPSTKQVAFTSGGDGKLHFLDAATLAVSKSVDAGGDADNVRLEARPDGDRLWVGCEEGLAVFAAADGKRVALVRLAGHAESFQLEKEKEGGRAFANVPSAKHVAVVDRARGEVVATWPLDGAASNFPMALDEKGARLYVGCRSPAEVVVLDTKSGKVVAKCPIAGDCDDLFLDPERARLYATCGEGCVSVLALEKDGSLKAAGRFATADGARTSLFVPSLAKLFVAAPKRGGHDAELHVVDVSGKTAAAPEKK
jgi:DNA-binding beta-propeller fold protein YncE